MKTTITAQLNRQQIEQYAKSFGSNSESIRFLVSTTHLFQIHTLTDILTRLQQTTHDTEGISLYITMQQNARIEILAGLLGWNKSQVIRGLICLGEDLDNKQYRLIEVLEGVK